VGRLISDRMSYRNHYMCSGEATSIIIKSFGKDKGQPAILGLIHRECKIKLLNKCKEKNFTNKGDLIKIFQNYMDHFS